MSYFEVKYQGGAKAAGGYKPVTVTPTAAHSLPGRQTAGFTPLTVTRTPDHSLRRVIMTAQNS